MRDNDILKWRAFFDAEDESPAIDWQETLLGSWLDCAENAESGVAQAITDYMGQLDVWENLIGEGEFFCTLHVDVEEPESCKGRYDVEVELKPKVTASRLP